MLESELSRDVGAHDLPGMGRTSAPETLRSANGVVDTLLAFAAVIAGGTPPLLIGHSAGGYFARGMTSRHPGSVGGLALICPLLPEFREVPEHRVVDGPEQIGDDGFRSYFVVQTPAMLERYERYVAPSAALVDASGMARIGEQWMLPPSRAADFTRPTLIVAGRCDSTVGYAAALDLVPEYPRATVAVLDDAGHALPHEQPELLRALIGDWLTRIQRA